MSLHSDLSDSTASLFSILGHESFEEDTPFTSPEEDDCFIVLSPARLESATLSQRKGDALTPERKNEPQGESPEQINGADVNYDSAADTDSPAPSLTPWQKWLIQKMEKERARQKKQEQAAKKKEMLAQQEAKDKEAFRQNLKAKAANLAKLRKKREVRKMAEKHQNEEEHVKETEKAKQKSMTAFRNWSARKQDERARKERDNQQKETMIKQIALQKALLAQQAFNDWLLTKQLSQDTSLRKSRFFSTPRPALSLPAWRGEADTDSLPFDFSTRLFLS